MQNQSPRSKRPAACALCDRAVSLTFHHLIPRRVHKRGKFLRQYTKETMRSTGLYICRLCHSGIHDIIPDERELAESYYTKELLLAHEGIARHVAWASKQKG